MFHLHLTAPPNDYEERLIIKLVKLGYSVASATEHGVVLQTSINTNVLISLKLHNDNVAIDSGCIYDDVVSILTDIRAQYYSLVITTFSYDARWNAGNIQPLPNNIGIFN